jgi:uncharacterized membrane protein YbhN (UPF0104 family)
MKLFLRLLGPAIFLFIIYYYVDFKEFKGIISILRWPYFSMSLVLVPPLIYLRSLRWQGILEKYGITYTAWKCFSVYFIEMVAVMVVATIGTFAKVFYLQRDGYGLKRPILTIIVDKYYDYLLPLIFGCTSVFLAWAKIGAGFGLLIFTAVTLLAFTPARKTVWLLSPRMLPKNLNAVFIKKGLDIQNHLAKIYDTLNFRTYLFSVAAFAIYFLCIYFLSLGLRIELGFFEVILIMTITSLVAMIPISFLGIGTRDAGLLAVFKWFGHTPEQAIALSMALLSLRIAIVLMGSIFWLSDPPPLNELKKLKENN